MKKLSIFLLALAAGAGTMLASDTSVDGIWYDFDGENLTAEVTYRGDDSESYSDRYSGEVVIPSSVIYNAQTYTVTSIGEWAFDGCTGLTSVTIPNSVTSIGKGAFWYCSGLISVTIGNSVTRIGNNAFYDCTGLTSVTIPNSVTSIGESAFSGCSSLPVVDNLRYADTYLVEAVNKSLSSYTIKDGTKWIGENAFIECYNLTSVTILNSVTRIGNSAFYGCSGLTSVEIPNSVTSIGEAAFSGCSGLTSVTIPSSVTSIEEGTFSGCSKLTSVTIPNTVTSIGTGAFSGCSRLTSVTNYATTPQTIYSSVFSDVNKSTCVLNVPKESVSLYQAANVWKEFTHIEAIPAPEPTYIDADFAIDFRTNPYTVVGGGALPDGVTVDGTYYDNLHGYQNVVATVPVKAGKYRLTLGTCQYGTGTGNVMSETNIELASFDQKTAACYHQNPTKNIISMIFDVDQDQTITIDCGQYTPYMKLEAVTAYHVSFALGDAEGTAPTALDVTVGEDTTMSVNKTMYKAGYTLTGWSDGVNTYAIGESFTPANDVVLTPVFTANEADLLNASTDVTVKWYFGGDNGAPTTSYERTSGLLVAQATIGDKTVDVKLSIDATSGKFAPQATTEWAQVNIGTIFTYPYKEGMTVNVDNYKSKVTYYIADAEGKVTCGENDYYSFIQVTYPASTPGPSTTIDEIFESSNLQIFKYIKDGQLLIERDGRTYNVVGTMIQ